MLDNWLQTTILLVAAVPIHSMLKFRSNRQVQHAKHGR
jgi:hypothetical protein